jgi:uncharacterized delta-60 repeat protein
VSCIRGDDDSAQGPVYARSVLRIAAIALVLLALAPAIASGDGAPDPSFGRGGSLSIAPQRFSSASGVAIDGQGRTLVGAMLEDGSMLRTRAAVLRLLPDGSLDPTFASGGVATIAAPDPFRTLRAESMAQDERGRIVFVGEVDEDIPAVVRVLPDGTLDPSFGSGGIVVARAAYAGLPTAWLSVAFDGPRIVVAGMTDTGPPFGTGLGETTVVARLDDNGAPDPAFASGGFLTLPIPGVTVPGGVAVDAGGRVVLGIRHATTTAFPGDGATEIVRLTSTGAMDTTFGDGGRVALGSGGSASVHIRSSGVILALGKWWHTALEPQFPVIAAELLPGGELNTTFGKGGELTAPTRVRFSGGALDCQGDLLMANSDGVTRFGPDGRLDPAFRGTGIPPVAVGDATAAATLGYFAFTSSGAVVLAGIAVDGPSVVGGPSPVGHYSIALARLSAACPVVDTRPPTVTLTCVAGCRRVSGTAFDDPVGRGVRRVLISVERIAGETCQAWNGQRYARVECRHAAARLVAVPLTKGTFRIPGPGRGRSIIRAVAVDRAGNRSRPVVLERS